MENIRTRQAPFYGSSRVPTEFGLFGHPPVDNAGIDTFVPSNVEFSPFGESTELR